MLFLKKKDKRYLNMQGDLVLTFNPVPIRANVGSAVPEVYNGLFCQVPKAGRIRSTICALNFIWGKNRALK